MGLVIHGFPDKLSALQFEWALANAKRTRFLKANRAGLVAGRTFSTAVSKNLPRLLAAEPWSSLPLTLHYNTDLVAPPAVKAWNVLRSGTVAPLSLMHTITEAPLAQLGPLIGKDSDDGSDHDPSDDDHDDDHDDGFIHDSDKENAHPNTRAQKSSGLRIGGAATSFEPFDVDYGMIDGDEEEEDDDVPLGGSQLDPVEMETVDWQKCEFCSTPSSAGLAILTCPNIIGGLNPCGANWHLQCMARIWMLRGDYVKEPGQGPTCPKCWTSVGWGAAISNSHVTLPCMPQRRM